MDKTFSDAFNEHLQQTGAKVTEIAAKANVSKEALYALKRGTTKNMAVGDAIRVASAFGETVEEFMGMTPNQVRDSLVTQLSQLTERERALLEASLTAILATRDPEER